MTDFTTYKNQVLKKEGGGKTFKVSRSWGVYDSYKHIRKNGWYGLGKPVTEHEFYTIIRKVNQYLADQLSHGVRVDFPYNMGSLELRKNRRGVIWKDGKLKITYPVDWEKTLQLWFEDEESRREKRLIRHEVPYVYQVRYTKSKATFPNKSFYDFVLNRRIKLSLRDHLKEGSVDTLWDEYEHSNT